MNRKYINLESEKFGRWTVLELSDKTNSSKDKYWICKCDCGIIKTIRGVSLRNGNSNSCGCFQKENAKKQQLKHGMEGTRTYKSWHMMKQRCLNENAIDYPRYGGRGIKICERWLGEHGFENFYADMGERPNGKTLDRFPDKNGNYEPTNCRWATPKQQQRNMTTNHLITFNNKTQCLTEWAEELGFPVHLIPNRIKNGWSVEDALTIPAKKL